MPGHHVCLFFCDEVLPDCVPECLQNLHSHQQLHQHLALPSFLMFTSQMGVKRHLIVVSICISLITNECQHLFQGLLAFWVWASGNLLGPFPNFSLAWRFPNSRSFPHVLSVVCLPVSIACCLLPPTQVRAPDVMRHHGQSFPHPIPWWQGGE